jgi:hypothetical protein
MRLAAAILLLALAPLVALAQQAPRDAIEATTGDGEKVYLLGDGRWEYADPKKAEPQREQRRVEDERERASQGGVFGVGRRIQPGDREYNRGSLNPKLR